MADKTTIAGLAADFDMEQWRTPTKRTWRNSLLEITGLICILLALISLLIWFFEAAENFFKII